MIVTEMSHYIPMYDTVGHSPGLQQGELQSAAAITSKTDVKYYAKLSPDTLLRQRAESEEYQVLTTEPSYNTKSASRPIKSTLLISLVSLLLILLLTATVTAVTLASIEWRNNAKLSAQLLEVHNQIATMKDRFMTLREHLMQSSLEKCLKDVSDCSVNPPLNTQILPACETARLLINKTVSHCSLYNNNIIYMYNRKGIG